MTSFKKSSYALLKAKRGATDTHEGDKKKPRLEVILQ